MSKKSRTHHESCESSKSCDSESIDEKGLNISSRSAENQEGESLENMYINDSIYMSKSFFIGGSDRSTPQSGTKNEKPSKNVEISSKNTAKSLSIEVKPSKKYNCKICDYSTNKESDYEKHNVTKKHKKRIAGESTRKTYQCDECEYTTPKWSNYDRHRDMHMGKERKCMYKCLACDESYTDTRSLMSHVCTPVHFKNVVERYPECLANPIYINKKLINRSRLNLKMREVYIKKLTGDKKLGDLNKYWRSESGSTSKGKNTKMRRIRNGPAKLSIKLKTSEFQDPEMLEQTEKKELIDRVYTWMKQNGMNPEDEGFEENYEEDRIEVIYKSINEIMNDDPKNYFLTMFEINVKGLVDDM